MLIKIFPVLVICIIMVSCSSLKQLNYGNNKQSDPSNKSGSNAVSSSENKEIKFLEDISTEPTSPVYTKVVSSGKTSGKQVSSSTNNYLNRSHSVEKATEVQLKYAVLLNTEVEQLENNQLLEYVDEWYGTRYRYGGTTKKGIDCSAFVQSIYISAFTVSLPRTAREQYRFSNIISATEMKTGDLVFFNTTGGVSHVGIYLQNNKFVHASVAYGVTISDMFDPYYLKRFIGIGRIDKPGAKIK
ncbi:MAG: C40 family peptidase [Chitinophagaceae bacterium]